MQHRQLYFSPLNEQFVDNNILVIDWDYIVQVKEFTEHQLEKYARFLKWDLVIKYQKVSKDLLKKVCVHVDLASVITEQYHLTDDDALDIYKEKLLHL